MARTLCSLYVSFWHVHVSLVDSLRSLIWDNLNAYRYNREAVPVSVGSKLYRWRAGLSENSEKEGVSGPKQQFVEYL